MADEGQLVRGFNWRYAFPFTHLFRAFRIAVHPSKLVLGLALLVVVFAGGSLLDAVWPRKVRAVPNETALWEAAPNAGAFEQARSATWDQIDAAYAQGLLDLNLVKVVPNQDVDKQALDDAHNGRFTSDATAEVVKRRDAEVDKTNDEEQKAEAAIQDQFKKDSDAEARQKGLDDARAGKADRVAQIEADAAAKLTTIRQVDGRGLFDSFFEYQTSQVTGVVESVLANRWSYGDASVGVLGYVYRFLTVGPLWLARAHTLFAVVFALLFLGAWSLFGGAISRIAAVHVARDEKISVRQSVDFAVGKFLSFASAPVLPLFIVIGIGLLVTLATLALGNIPFVGPIIVGVFGIVALLGGFVMTLVLLGTIGGFNLMYPTVAVEGSDSFDAISRSFSYVYARPWRMLFYTVVAVAYGAATYLFIKLFISLTLLLTHHFVGMGLLLHDTHGHPLLGTMWPDSASTGRLTYKVDWSLLNWGDRVGAGFLRFWVYLIVGVLGAYAISFYFSANTIIYYLMRQELDATELQDVYLEQSEEDFDAMVPVTGAAITSQPVPKVPLAPGAPTPIATAAPVEPPAPTV